MLRKISKSGLTSISRIPASLIGGGDRVFDIGSGIGSDPAMIAANHRCKGQTLTKSFCSKATVSRNDFTLKKTSLNVAGHSVGQLQQRFFSEKSEMDDEYGEMTADGNTYVHSTPFVLESEETIENAQVRYMTYGTLNEARDNVLVVCHALTGNASLHSWWGDLLGPGLAFDTDKFFIVSSNILGSCYGSTGPASRKFINGVEKDIYGMSFPDVSVRDSVKLQLHMLRTDLDVRSVKCVIGGSFGGMQAVEFAAQAGRVDSPFSVDDQYGNATSFVRSVMPIACGAAHTAWQIGISEVQRQAVRSDPKWNGGNPSWDDPPIDGLSLARQIGMISYRTPQGYENKFGRTLRDGSPAYGSDAQWDVKSYLEYQGYKFLSRFDPITYVKLTEQMDTHDVGRNRGGKENALSGVRIPCQVLGIDSDILYPLYEQEELSKLFPNGDLKVINSDAGHDGFLLEQDQVANYISSFLAAHD